jgi:serine/threonine-protein kinase HipA
MHYCPITLEPIADGEDFSAAGLRSFHPRLKSLAPLELSYEDQLRQARTRSDKMSIQGVQPKLSAILKLKDGKLQIVDNGGRFILKPNPRDYEEVPANEALTMTLARRAGIDTPAHGLVSAIDGSWVYAVRRFDREGRSGKIHVEDFAQLSNKNRDTKYESSLERVAEVVKEHCTFPNLEKPRLARRLLFCFLTGNEDMHLKNFSLIVSGKKVTLSPAYDLLNSSLVLGNPAEESALPLKGKKKNLTRKLWIDYYCRERLGLSETITSQLLNELRAAIPAWRELIGHSHLSPPKKQAYGELVDERAASLGLLQ